MPLPSALHGGHHIERKALEEVRRLFYVAAKRNLFLSSPKVTGRGSFYAMDPGGPLRFLFEITNLDVLVQRPS
jgi:superfamily I DNA/RNA helicase